MIRLNPGAGKTISLQVMSVITTSPEPLAEPELR
jgi:hypothetical protein